MNDICLILTATINPGTMTHTARSDPTVRFHDYQESLRFWVQQASVRNIIFCENSGFDLSHFDGITVGGDADAQIEFISAPKQQFPVGLGKGYGEMQILNHITKHSEIYKRVQGFVKVSGRYKIANADRLMKSIESNSQCDVICDLSRNLTWADSRIFYASSGFLENYLTPRYNEIDDSKGVYFEHVLARAIHEALSDTHTWNMWPLRPEIVGISGTSNVGYQTFPLRKVGRRLWHRLSRFVIER